MLIEVRIEHAAAGPTPDGAVEKLLARIAEDGAVVEHGVVVRFRGPYASQETKWRASGTGLKHVTVPEPLAAAS